MMDVQQLRNLVARGESETLEFKQTTGERHEAMQSLVAMLNCHGGRILFGIGTKGELLGQQVADRTIEELSQGIQWIEPNVFPNIEKHEVRPGLYVISIETERGPNPPYSYRNQAYRRVGNTSLKLSRDEYNRMLIERFHGEQRWETVIAEGWAISDLNISEITRTVDEAIRRGRLEDPGTRDAHEMLRGLGLLRDDKLIRAAVVLFGSQQKLQAEYTQCLLRTAKFRGTDKSEFEDNRQFHGNAFDLLLKGERFLRDHLPIAGRVVTGLFARIDEPLYPPVALREALANAFCHRDYLAGSGSVDIAIYQDRLEITSSGMLHFDFTPELLYLPHASRPWNPSIAKVFYYRGIIETWGRGIQKMVELSEKAGQPRPEIEEQTNAVLIRFRPSAYIPPTTVTQELTPSQRLLLELIAKSNPILGIPRRDLVRATGLTEIAVRDDLQQLQTLDLVMNIGHGRGSFWYLKSN